jgi:hypothetical protein
MFSLSFTPLRVASVVLALVSAFFIVRGFLACQAAYDNPCIGGLSV